MAVVVKFVWFVLFVGGSSFVLFEGRSRLWFWCLYWQLNGRHREGAEKLSECGRQESATDLMCEGVWPVTNLLDWGMLKYPLYARVQACVCAKTPWDVAVLGPAGV